MANIAALILAAGAGSRFIPPATNSSAYKQLALINGQPMLQTVVDRANTVLPGKVFTVLGNNWRSIAEQIAHTEFMVNPCWSEGLGRSIGWAVTELMAGPNNYDGLLLLLGDQPLITSENIKELIERFDPQWPVCAFYNQSVGVPALFPRALFSELAQLHSDTGAKAILQSMGDQVSTVPMPEAATDIDTIENLQVLLNQ